MPEVRDLLDAILIGMFLFGLVLTTATLLLGVGDIGVHGGHVDGHVGGDGHGGFLLPFGLAALLVGLTWFGGLGYVLRRAADWPALLALPAAALLGVVAGALVQRAVRALSNSGQAELDPERYRLPGSIGRVSSPIRAGGVGEVVYEQAGVRQVVAARAAGERALPRGAEVVVLRVERGVATVEELDAAWERSGGDRMVAG